MSGNKGFTMTFRGKQRPHSNTDASKVSKLNLNKVLRNSRATRGKNLADPTALLKFKSKTHRKNLNQVAGKNERGGRGTKNSANTTDRGQGKSSFDSHFSMNASEADRGSVITMELIGDTGSENEPPLAAKITSPLNSSPEYQKIFRKQKARTLTQRGTLGAFSGELNAIRGNEKSVLISGGLCVVHEGFLSVKREGFTNLSKRRYIVFEAGLIKIYDAQQLLDLQKQSKRKNESDLDLGIEFELPQPIDVVDITRVRDISYSKRFSKSFSLVIQPKLERSATSPLSSPTTEDMLMPIGMGSLPFIATSPSRKVNKTTNKSSRPSDNDTVEVDLAFGLSPAGDRSVQKTRFARFGNITGSRTSRNNPADASRLERHRSKALSVKVAGFFPGQNSGRGMTPSSKQRTYYFHAKSGHMADAWVQSILFEVRNQAAFIDRSLKFLQEEESAPKIEQNLSNVDSMYRQSIDLWSLAKGKVSRKTLEAMEVFVAFLEAHKNNRTEEVFELQKWKDTVDLVSHQLMQREEIISQENDDVDQFFVTTVNQNIKALTGLEELQIFNEKEYHTQDSDPMFHVTDKSIAKPRRRYTKFSVRSKGSKASKSSKMSKASRESWDSKVEAEDLALEPDGGEELDFYEMLGMLSSQKKTRAANQLQEIQMQNLENEASPDT